MSDLGHDDKIGGMDLDVQYIKHPASKERLAVLPETQLRTLQRMAMMRLVSLGERQGASDLPASLREKIEAGENPLRVIREWRGLTGQQLAALAGVTPSLLSQIERHGKTGSARTFRSLATILGVPIDVIFPAASKQDDK